MHGLLGANVLSNVAKSMIDFMASFSTSMLLVIVLLAFMLATRQRRKVTGREDFFGVSAWKRMCVCCPCVDKDALERERMATEKRRNMELQAIEKMSLQDRITATTVKYVSLKTKICLAASILVWISLVALQVPLSGMIALLSFFLNYIPNFGPFIATLIPLPIILLDDSITQATGALAIIVPAFIHMVVGNVIEPVVFMQDEAIDMHPVVTVACIIVWYVIWGVPGAILAVPITTLLRIVAVQVSINNPENTLAFVVMCMLEGKMPYSSGGNSERAVISTNAARPDTDVNDAAGEGLAGSPNSSRKRSARSVLLDVERGGEARVRHDSIGREALTQMFQFVLLSIALGWLLVYLKEVTIPYVLSLFLMFLFSPLADATERGMFSCCRCCKCCDPTWGEENAYDV